MTWILGAAPGAAEAASSLFVSAFNLSIALGAFAGGLAVDGVAATSVLWIGAVLVLAAARFAVGGARRAAGVPAG
jgi:predicted MFS family arabinose efflux permease